MARETGEEIVGAWLRYCAGCDFVDYDVQIPAGGEIDVIGLRLRDRHAYICEVATHIHGLQYKDNKGAILGKFARAISYVGEALPDMRISYEFWSPVVRRGLQMDAVKHVQSSLRDDHGIELNVVINQGTRTDSVTSVNARHNSPGMHRTQS